MGQVAQSLAMVASSTPDVAMSFAARQDCDLRDRNAVAEVVARLRPDVVINAAAYTKVDQAEQEEELAFAVNAQGAGHVAEACAARGVPLIHLSTDYVFDGEKPAPYIESDPPNPINAYGRSKLAGERAVQEHCDRHLIVRTSWVHSPFGHNFVRTMLRLALTQESVRVVDDQFGCPTYAPHLADALLVMARRAAATPADAIWGTYHAAGQGETNWSGFAKAIFEASARVGGPQANVIPIPSEDYATPARRPRHSRLGCESLRNTFYVSLPDWAEGVRDCVESVRLAQR
jgi:dTDP-4-dehydrorhamnose reductase